MKKMICKILSVIMILTSATAISVSADEAVPTASTVLVNGKNVEFDSYNINGNNYFKLRDLAYVLNATEKQFSIGYNEVLNTVSLTSRQPYIAVGGEMEIGDGSNVKTEPTSSTILKNGEAVQLQAYLINDSNYFKLRDIGELFDFSVDWNGEENSISIDTSKSYVSENEGDKVIEDTYYSRYQIGDTVEMSGRLIAIEEYRGEKGRWGTALLIARIADEYDNTWIVALNLNDYGIGHKSDFEKYVNQKVSVKGIYEGYSKKEYELPVITLYEMIGSDNDVISGIRKVSEILDKGNAPIESEKDINITGYADAIENYLAEIQFSIIGE